MRLSAPTGIYIFDAFIRGVLVLCFVNVVVSSYQLGFKDAPISTSLRIIRYLMEEDATACKQQNTKENREIKYGKV